MPIKFGEHTLKLRRYIVELKIFLVKFGVAVFAKPEQPIKFSVASFSFDDKANGVGSANGIVRNSRRQQEHLAFADRHIDRLSMFLNFYYDIAFDLIEKFLALVPMIIFARIGPANDHHNKIVGVINALIPDRRLEQMSVLVNPLHEVEGAPDRHSIILIE